MSQSVQTSRRQRFETEIKELHDRALDLLERYGLKEGNATYLALSNVTIFGMPNHGVQISGPKRQLYHIAQPPYFDDCSPDDYPRVHALLDEASSEAARTDRQTILAHTEEVFLLGVL